MDNWWLAASSQQEIFGKTSNYPGDSAPYNLDLLPCDFWLFPKLKSTLKGKRYQTVNEIQENMTGQLMVIGRTVWGPKVPTLKGLRRHCPVYNVSCIFFNKCLFHSTGLDTFWTDLVYTQTYFLWFVFFNPSGRGLLAYLLEMRWQYTLGCGK